MKSFLSLMLVMTMILVVPASITSCVKSANATETIAETIAGTDVGTDVGTDGTAAVDVAATTATVTTSLDGLLGWQNITIMALGILSALFAGLWKKARNVIAAVDEALQDGTVSKPELAKIIAAWKG
jgi:hypothetical protein